MADSRKDEGLLTEGKPNVIEGEHSNGIVALMSLHVKGGKPQINLTAIPFKGAENPTFDQLQQRVIEDTGCENAVLVTAAAVRMKFTEIMENCPAANKGAN